MMEKKKKIQEPYKPEDTPEPPQIIDPDAGNEKKKPVKEKPQSRSSSKPDGTSRMGGRPGRKPDIDDETTI